MQFLKCHGAAREVGRQQGEHWRELVQERLDEEVLPNYRDAACEDDGFTARVAQTHQRLVEFAAPEYSALIEEIGGIGEGAGITFVNAMLLSTYNSTFSACRRATAPPASAGCTAIAFAAGPRAPFVFKTNDDFGSPETESSQKRQEKARHHNRFCRALKITDRNGASYLGVRYAGSVWTEIGVNGAGLAMGSASLHPRLDEDSSHGFPQHWLGTIVLKYFRSVAEAQEKLSALPVFGKGYAMALCDTSGNALGVEKAGAGSGFNAAVQGVAFQTNHIRSPALATRARQGDSWFWQGEYFYNSQQRMQRVEDRRAAWTAGDDFETLLGELTHTRIPGAFIQDGAAACQHWLTVWAALVFPQSRELWVAEETPEEWQFEKWNL